MVLGLAGVWKTLKGGKKLQTLELDEKPNMLFVYLLAVVGALTKPRWHSGKSWPVLQVKLTKPAPLLPSFLATFRRLAGWAQEAPEHVPLMAHMTESFRLCMALMTLPAFPVSILGTVVNKRARYSMVRAITPDEPLTYSCRLAPEVTETFSGHAEFHLHLEAVSAKRGDVVWQAALTLVLMNPKKKGGKRGASGQPADAVPDATAGPPLDTWVLPADTGRRYASLDGDLSPMHLYKWSAALMGFSAPVANVHFIAARAEASLAAALGEPALPAPATLELEFKRPTLLPAKLTLAPVPAGQDVGRAAVSALGFSWRVDDRKGKPIALGAYKATRAG